MRVCLENRFDEYTELYEAARGLESLRLASLVERVERKLDWQAANPKDIPIEELTEAIRAPVGDDRVEDSYRARIRNHATAIRAYCVICMGGSVADIRTCPSVTCPLFPFRMGENPLRGFELPKVVEPELDTELVDDDYSDDDEDEDEDDTDAS